MKSVIKFSTMTAAIALSTLLSAGAQDLDLEINDAWTRATAPNAKMGSGYLSITSNADTDVRLVSAEVDADIADRVELHTIIHEDGNMSMVEVEDGFAIPAGGTLELKPKGNHLMIMGLASPLVADETLTVTLNFDNGTSHDTALSILSPAEAAELTYGVDEAGDGEHAHHDHSHDHKHDHDHEHKHDHGQESEHNHDHKNGDDEHADHKDHSHDHDKDQKQY